MKSVLFMLARWILLVIVFIVLFVAGGSLTSSPELVALLTPEQQESSATVLPIVGLILAGCIIDLALRSRWNGWKLAGALFVVLYGICTVLTQIETAVFPAVADQLPDGALRGFFISGLILAAPFSLLAVWILGRTRKGPSISEASDRLQMPIREWIWKFAAAAILYVIVYFTFGYYVAWRTPGLPEFYSGTDPGSSLGQLGNVARDTPWLPFYQIFRGLIWAAIGCLIIRMHKGKPWETALAVGITFAALISTGLLFPNPFMPPAVAGGHALELSSSMVLYGILLTILMLWKPAQQTSPTKETPNAD